MMLKAAVGMAGMAAVHAFGGCPGYYYEGYCPQNQNEAWTNHFDAFAAQDVDKIALDYIDASELQVFFQCANNGAGAMHQFNGQAEIRTFFTLLFEDLYDLSTLRVYALDEYTAPLDPAGGVEGSGVLLVWSNEGTGYDQVTITEVFDQTDFTIRQQNIVVASSDYDGVCAKYSTEDAGNIPFEATTDGSIQGSWDNHFSAFGAQDVDAIMEDYDEESVLTIYDFHTFAYTEYQGLDAIRSVFEGLFSDLENYDTLSAPVVDTNDAAPNTFLVWQCPDCSPLQPQRYAYVTDTFTYSSAHQCANGDCIIRQNIVVFSESYE